MIEDTNLVSRATAEKLKVLLTQTPGMADPRPSRVGAQGRMPVIVRCTSATAAGGSSIGDQCYPAVMLAGHASASTQPEQTAVWLTVLGAGGVAVAPVEDSLYYGMFAGDFDPGTGRRPRVFSVLGGGSSAAQECGGGCGSLVGLAADATLKLSLVCATGSFAAIDTDQFIGVYAFGSGGTWTFQKWTDGSPGSWGNVTLDWLGSTGTAVFTWNATALPTLTLGGTTLTLRCLGSDATFAAGPRNGINGDGAYTPAAECESNELVLNVECSCTPPDGWEGPEKWYCVDEVATYLADECAAVGLTIDSGPYDTQEDAEVDCPPPPTAPCQSAAFDETSAVYSNKTGDCTCLPDDTTALSVTGGTDSLSWSTNTCPGNASHVLSCVGGFYEFTVGGVAATLVSFAAGPPVVLVYDTPDYGANCGGAGGAARITITSV